MRQFSQNFALEQMSKSFAENSVFTFQYCTFEKANY